MKRHGHGLRWCWLAGLALAWPMAMAFGQDYHNRKFQEVEPQKPFYLTRKGEDWQQQSRIVGTLRNPPRQFTVSVVNAMTMQEIRTETHSGALSVYQTGWLPLGRYDIIIRTEGFLDQKIPGLQLKAGSDCVINLYFNPKIYRGR